MAPQSPVSPNIPQSFPSANECANIDACTPNSAFAACRPPASRRHRRPGTCSICVPFWPRIGSVHVPIVFRKGPANHHDPATKRNIMEQNGTHFSAQPSIVRPKRPSAYLSEGAVAGSAASRPSRPEHRRHFRPRSGPRPQLRRDCHIFTQIGSCRIQTVFNPCQIRNSLPAPSATKSDRMLRNVTLLGSFTFNSGPPSGAPPTPSPFKKDCRRRRPRASVKCAGAYLAPPLL